MAMRNNYRGRGISVNRRRSGKLVREETRSEAKEARGVGHGKDIGYGRVNQKVVKARMAKSHVILRRDAKVRGKVR